ATLTTLPARNADATGYVGAGLSPGDEYYDEPYFYVSVYPEPDPAALPSLPTLGHWHLRDFMAAIATAHKIAAAKNQQAETDDFLRAAVDGAIKVLSNGHGHTLGVLWPSGWTWGQGHSHYLMMVIGVYGTLGVFLLIAARNPYAHTSLIWFTVWSSVVHAAIMGVQAVSDPAERGHLLGDVPALILVAVVLAVLTPRGLHKL